jgi:hypothetical protein
MDFRSPRPFAYWAFFEFGAEGFGPRVPATPYLFDDVAGSLSPRTNIHNWKAWLKKEKFSPKKKRSEVILIMVLLYQPDVAG